MNQTEIVTDKRKDEQQKVYVTMTDSFMSGWGPAKGKTNKYVLECESYEEAEIVAANARRRSEMKYVNITKRCPKDNGWRLVSLVKAKDTSFVIPGFFKCGK